MSAFICSPEHIGAIAHFLVKDSYYERRFGGLKKVVEALVDTNIESVEYRYSDIKGISVEEFIGMTRNELVREAIRPTKRRYSPIEVAKLAFSYQYQSCEHPGWKDSKAYEIVECVIGQAVREMPGYEAAPWAV